MIRSGFQSGSGIGGRNEKNLVKDLIDESIQIMGIDVYYLPRTLVNPDMLFGEDNLSYFKQFIIIEMYLESFDRFGGQNEIFTRFGVENKEEAIFRVSRRRWEDSIGSTGVAILDNRPTEGDLIYYPTANKIFEIKFVDHKDPFYELNDYYSYKLECTLFQYGSEIIETGAEQVDIAVPAALDNLKYPFLAAGENILYAPKEQLKNNNIEFPIDKNNINNELTTDNTGIQNFDENNIFGSI